MRQPVNLLAVAVFSCSSLYAHGWIKVIPPTNNSFIIDSTAQITVTSPPNDGALGRLVVANPINACTPLASVPYPSNETLRWFLLARRYGCVFNTKFVNAQKAGYAGIIIYDSDDSEAAIFNYFPRPFGFGDIYSVLVSRSEGHRLRQCTYDRGYVLDWYPSDEFSLLSYLIPCIGILLFCFLMITFLVVTQYCARRYRERRRTARYRLAKKYLKQLPVKRWTRRSDEFEKYETCSICLEDYQEGDKIRLLPCLHAYHATKCIDIWLTKNRRICPLCKRKIVLPGMPEDSSDDETSPLLGTQHETNGGTFQEEPQAHSIRVEVDIEAPDDEAGSSGHLYAAGGLYSVNDEVEVMPARRARKKKKKTRRSRNLAVLDDVNTAGPSSEELGAENQMVIVTEYGTDDDQPLLA